jgi:hypothetical protein
MFFQINFVGFVWLKCLPKFKNKTLAKNRGENMRPQFEDKKILSLEF